MEKNQSEITLGDMKFKCASCGEETTLKMPNIIRVNKSPETLSLLMNKELMTGYCPKCESYFVKIAPLTFIDEDRKYAVLVRGRKKLYEIDEKRNDAQLNELQGKYEIYAATTIERMRDIIISKEFGLNPLVVRCTISYMEFRYLKTNPTPLLRGCLCVYNGELFVELQLKNDFKIIHLPFDYNIYSIMNEKYAERFTYDFDLTFFKQECGLIYTEIHNMVCKI